MTEIGIRMALGGGTMRMLRMVVSASMTWVLAGLAAGLAGSAAVTRLLSGLLYDVPPLDPMVLGRFVRCWERWRSSPAIYPPAALHGPIL